MKNKPVIKKNKKTGNWVAYLNYEDQIYTVTAPTMKEVIKKWYKEFGKKFGLG